MFLGTHPLALNVRPLVAYNLALATRGANALQEGTAALHTQLSRTSIAAHLRAAERDATTTPAHRWGLQTMLAARNVGTVVTVPLDFAFGTGRWEDLGRASERPMDFVKESLAHPCSLGVAGATIAITVGLWSVIAAFGTALAGATYAGLQVLTQGQTGNFSARYRAMHRKMLLMPPFLYAASIATSAWLLGARTLGRLPLAGPLVRTPFVRRLPFIAPLALIGPTMVLCQGRLVTGLVKATIAGAAYGAGYLAGLVSNAFAERAGNDLA